MITIIIIIQNESIALAKLLPKKLQKVEIPPDKNNLLSICFRYCSFNGNKISKQK